LLRKQKYNSGLARHPSALARGAGQRSLNHEDADELAAATKSPTRPLPESAGLSCATREDHLQQAAHFVCDRTLDRFDRFLVWCQGLLKRAQRANLLVDLRLAPLLKRRPKEEHSPSDHRFTLRLIAVQQTPQ